MAQYGKAEYWDERYTRDPEPFDWYQRWAGLKDVLEEYLKPDAKILVVGCGNSRLTEEIYEHGEKDITNIDISNVVITAMQSKYSDKPELKWSVENICELEQPSEQFDVVLDKGTLDAILCGENSSEMAQKALMEVARCLKPGGVYINISHGQPAYRHSYMIQPEFKWEVQTLSIPKPSIGVSLANPQEEKDNVHHIYICSKEKEEE